MKLIVIEELPNKPHLYSGYLYKFQRVNFEVSKLPDFYRRQKVNLSNGVVTSCSYALCIDSKKWESALWKFLPKQ